MRILFLNQAPGPAGYDVERIETLLNSYASPGTTVEIGFPEEYDGGHIAEVFGGESAVNTVRHLIRGPALLLKTLWAEENGYDAVIQSNTFDPGVEVGRAVVKIPVIGLLRTSLHAGLNLADRIGITVSFPEQVPYVWRILRAYGVDSLVAGVRALDEEAFPGLVHSSDRDNTAQIAARAVAVFQELVALDGAEIILPLGGAVIPYLVDPAELQRSTSVQVLNTKAIAIRFAEMCVDFGLTQSFLTYPRRPR